MKQGENEILFDSLKYILDFTWDIDLKIRNMQLLIASSSIYSLNI